MTLSLNLSAVEGLLINNGEFETDWEPATGDIVV